MKHTLDKIRNNYNLQIFLMVAVLLLMYRTIFGTNDSYFIINIISEILVVLTFISISSIFAEHVSKKKSNPNSLVINVGIIILLILFALLFSENIIRIFYSGNFKVLDNLNIPATLVVFFIVLFLIASLAYVFLVFKEFFFLRQKKNVKLYFNTMAIYFLLASLATLLDNFKGLEFIKQPLLIVAIILIAINSFKISWIAFITKKEKKNLLLYCVILLGLLIANIAISSDNQSFTLIIKNYSPALFQFYYLILLYGLIYFSILFFTTLFHLPTAEAYDRKAEEVSSLHYLSKMINQVLDFSELAETVTELTLKVSSSSAAWIIWKENEIKILSAKNISISEAKKISAALLIQKELKEAETTVTFNLGKYFTKELTEERYSYITLAPIKTHGEIKGYIVAARKDEVIYDDEEKKLLDTFSDYASIAFDNSRLLLESIEKERLEKELDVAREIQRKILPAKTPNFENLDISAVFIPAFEVGGDYYDFFNLSNDNFGFVIADVSGKGISAAFIMAEIKGIFESLSQIMTSPKEILINVNKILERTLERKSFVSATYGIINFNTKTIKFARAGHCPFLLIRNGKAERLKPSGVGLGLNYTNKFENNLEEMEIKLEENDIFVLYTDGITEAKDISLTDFGEERFEEILIKKANENVDSIANEVIQEISQYSKNNSQHDDITLVIFKWK